MAKRIVVLILLLAALDILFTVIHVTHAKAIELNPIIAYLLAQNIPLAVAVKMLMTCIGIGGLWLIRKSIPIMTMLWVLFFFHSVLLGYHIALAVHFW